MDKKEWTPEDIELKEALNKLYETDTRMPSKPLDLSFMESPEKDSFYKRHKRLINVAAIVLLMVITSVSTAIFVSNDYASAVQDKIQRKVFEMKHGVVVATAEEFAEEGETVWEIDDFEVAKKAKELVPELPIPGYMPEGYEFEKLVLHLYNDGRYIADYNYNSQNDNIYISCQLYEDNNNFTILGNIKTLKLPDRTITLWEDPSSSTTGASVIKDNSIITIISSGKSLSYNQLHSISTKLI